MPPSPSHPHTGISRTLLWLSLCVASLFFVACNGRSPADLLQTVVTATPSAAATADSAAVFDETIDGRLAVIDTRGRLVTMNALGEEVNQLSTDSSIFRFPAWSPVGNQIAVIGDNDTVSGVFVFDDEADGEPTLVHGQSGNPPIYLYWLPDGKSVSFITNARDELAFFVTPADGSTESEQINMGQPFYWQWLPNSKQALIHTGDDTLAFMDRDGVESVTGLGNQGAFQAPALSVGNRYMAYQELREDGRFIVVKNMIDDEIALSEAHQGLLTMSWSPSQSQLAYSSPQGEGVYFGPLLLWDAAENSSQVLTRDEALAFYWSPDGRYIAYLTLKSIGQQAKVEGVAQQRRFFTLGLIDVETGGQRYIAAFEPNPVFVNQILPYFDQYALSHRVWSPDSQALAMPVIDDQEEPKVMVFPIDGQAPYAVADGFLAFWSHQ